MHKHTDRELIQRQSGGWTTSAPFLRSNPERNEVDSHPPPYCFPIHSNFAEFHRLRTFVATRRHDANCDDSSIYEGKDEVSRCNLSHEFIERITGVVRIALRRPEVATGDLLPICLVLVYPPVAHDVESRGNVRLVNILRSTSPWRCHERAGWQSRVKSLCPRKMTGGKRMSQHQPSREIRCIRYFLFDVRSLRIFWVCR